MEKDLRIRIKIDKQTGELKVITGELDQVSRSAKKTTQATKSFENSLKAIGAQVGGLYLVTKAFNSIIRAGFEFNKNIENSVAGLTMLTVVTSSNTSALGRHLSMTEKYNLAQKEAMKTTKELIRINVQTPHTLNQTILIYKSMYASMKKAGATNEQMIELTKKLSIAAGSAGVEFSQLLAGVDGLANGTVLANSDLGRFLGSLGLTNQTLKNSGDVVGLLLEKFKDFKAVDTMSVAISNLNNAWQQLAGAITKDTFDTTKTEIKELTKFLNENRDAISSFVTGAQKAFIMLGTRIALVVTETRAAWYELRYLNAYIANKVTFGLSSATLKHLSEYKKEILILQAHEQTLKNELATLEEGNQTITISKKLWKGYYDAIDMYASRKDHLVKQNQINNKEQLSFQKEQLKLQKQLTNQIIADNPYNILIQKRKDYISQAKGDKETLLLVDKWYDKELNKLNIKRIKDYEDREDKKIEYKNKLYTQELSEAQKIKEKIESLAIKYLADQRSQYKNYYVKVGDYAKEWEKIEEEIKEKNKYLKEEELTTLVNLERTEFYDKIKKQRYDNYEQAKKDQKAYEYDQLKSYGTIADGFAYYTAEKMPTDFEIGIEMMKDLTQTLNDAWTDFFDTQSDAFMDFGKLGKSIINDIEKQIVQTQIVAPLTSATTSLVGSVTGSLLDSLFSGWADGGYTYRDSNDKTPVGVVHANEYVVPANMVRKHPSLIAGLEAERRGLKPFWSGGSASDDADSSGFGGTGNSDSMGGIGNASSSENNNSFNGMTVNNIQQQTVISTNMSQIAPASQTVIDLDPNHTATHYSFDAYGNPIGDNKGYSFSFDGTALFGKALGFAAGAATGNPHAATAGAVLGGKIGEKVDNEAVTTISWGQTSFDEALGLASGKNTSNTGGYLDSVFGDGGDGFYNTYSGQTIGQAIDDIKAKLKEANKQDIIEATQDLWQGMVDVIPTIKTDATEDWATLFNNYIEDGNSALLKVALDGSLFDTPDFYSTWEEYAKNLNESVQKALSDKLGELTTNTRTFKEWQYGFNGDSTGALKYKADYLADDLQKLEDSMGVAGISVENFYDEQQKAIANNLTPEEIDKWNNLGSALMSASDAQKEYQDALDKSAQATQDAINSLAQEAQKYTGTLYTNDSDSFAFYADRYNSVKNQVDDYVKKGDYAGATKSFSTLEGIANSVVKYTNNDNVSKKILSDFTNYEDLFNSLSIVNQNFTPFATGGIVTSPTLSLIGEAGTEAVIPLNNNLPPQLDNSEVVAELKKLRDVNEQMNEKITRLERVISRNEGENGLLMEVAS